MSPRLPEISPSLLAIAKDSNGRLICSTISQPGMSLTWLRNRTSISNDGFHSVATSASGTDVNNTLSSNLTIRADWSIMSKNFTNCTVANTATGKVRCATVYQCQVYYNDMPSVNASSSLVEVAVTNLNGKCFKIK